MQKNMDELEIGLKKAIKNNKDAISKLKSAVDFHIRFNVYRRDRVHVSVWDMRSLNEEYRKKIKHRIKNYEAVFINILLDGSKSGLFDIKNHKVIAFAILKICNGVGDWYRENEALSLEQVIDTYNDLLFTGLIPTNIKNVNFKNKHSPVRQ